MTDTSVRTFCERHWAKVRATPGVNDLAAALELAARFYDKVTAERGTLTTEQMRAALVELAPPCCYLGEKAVDEIIIVAQAIGRQPGEA